MLDPAAMHFDPLPTIIFERDRVILDREAAKERKPLDLPIHGEQMVAIGGVSFTPNEISIHAPPAVAPVHLRMNTSDLPTFYQVFSKSEYDIEFPNEVKTIVDLGANIGLAAAYLKGRYPDANIVCVEPNAENYKMLQKNIAGLDGVTAIHAAVWPVAGRLEVVDTDASGKPLGFWGAQTRLASEQEGTDVRSEVSAITISEIMRRSGFEKIDLLKVDIEGAEFELFSENTHEWLPHVGSLVIETHDRFKPGSTDAVRAALGPYRYEERRSGENLVFTKGNNNYAG
jgi:FkbM family methyltransferase